MRLALITISALLVSLLIGCGGGAKEVSPLETLQKYVEAVKKKDTTQMKLLLSEATLKLHTDQAKAQNTTVDEIVKRETLFPPDQRVFSYKNVKVEGDKATIDVKNNFGSWDQIFLVRESGVWKIDKKGTAEQMIEKIESDVDSLDEQMDAERKKTEELLDKHESEFPAEAPNPVDSPKDPAVIEPPKAAETPVPAHSDIEK
ncbi:MAG: nuclear transport factor 2 family protein [Pyrinomonadaceae bacterium]